MKICCTIPSEVKRFLISAKKIVALIFILGAAVPNLNAQSITVSTTADEVNGNTSSIAALIATPGGTGISLREAVIASNNEPAGATITITLPAGNFALTITGAGENNAATGDLDINHTTAGTKTITINGAGAASTIITGLSGANGDRVFDVHPLTGAGAFLNFTLSNVTVTGASLTAGSGAAILAGRAGDVTTLTNCTFSNNTAVSNGGAISQSSGANAHDLNVTGCTFSGNTATGAVGGAINYSGTGTVNISGCTFSGNTAGTQGGALNISGNGAGPSACNILRNTFTTNTANGNAFGGAVTAVTNAQSVIINFNRIVGNTAANVATGKMITTSGGTVGTMNNDNNWWGVNTGPVSGTDILGTAASNWLQLKATASPASVSAGGTSTVTASFLSNSANAAVTTANLTALIGRPVSFVNPVLGALSGAQTTIQPGGTATVTFTAGGTSGAGSVNAVVDNVPNNEASPARAIITVLAPPTVTVTGTPLSAFTSCSGTASAAQSFTVSGSNLTTDIIITAPAGFQISTTSGSGFTNTLTLPQSGGSVANTTIYVRLAASATGTPSGNITVASTGVTTVNVAVSGTVTSAAPAAFAGNDASVCALNTTLAANAPAPGTGAWTQTAGPGTTTFGDATSPLSTVTASVQGVYTYRWTITNGVCPSTFDDVIITFASTPPTANAGPDQFICSTSATLNGNSPTVGTGLWQQTAGPVTATIATPASPATTISGLTTAGAYTFRWTISNLLCTASSDEVTINVSSPPDVNPVTNQSVCTNSSTNAITFSGSVPGTIYNWTNNNTSIGLAASGTGNIAAFTATNSGTTPVTATITVTPQRSFVSSETPPSGWTNATPFTVIENSGNLLTNYQLRMVINTQSFVTAGTMNASGDDIRFGYNNGSVLFNYWIESGMNTANTVVWVKIDTLAANGTKQFFMYHGNPAATSVSAVPGTFAGPHSATDSVASGGAAGVANSQRGFRFAPTEDLLVTHFGKREPTGTTRYVTLFDFATQAVIRQIQVSGPAAQYSYGGLSSPIWLTSGTQYLLELYQGVSDGYYFGTSSQIGQHLTYFDMRYCNTCTQNTFPTSVLTNYHYGYPDFWYFTKNNVTPAPTYTSSGSCTGTPQTFTITVNPVPDAIANPASQTACGTISPIVLSGAVSGTTYNWTRDNTAGVTGIAASGSGNITGSLINTTASPITVTFTITPVANGCTSTPVTATVLVNPSPGIICPANISLSNTTGQCGRVVTYTTTASGSPGPALTYTFTGATTGSGSGDGSGSTFNVGVTNVTLTVTNVCGTTNCTFTVTINDTQAPTVTTGVISSCYPTVAAAEAAALAATSATDNCPGALTEAASTVGTCSAVITVTTTDAAGNSTAITYNTRIDNTPPAVTVGTIASCYPTVAAAQAAALAATNATDNCPGALTEVASTVGTCSTVITVTTTDACGNATAVTYNTRIDNTPPTVTVGTIGTCYPTVAAAEAAALAATSATDNCPGALTEVASTVGTCSAVITVTTTDACGNATAVTYNTRIDNTPPAVTVGTISSCYPTIAAAEAAALAATSATDNCPGALTEAASTVGTCSAVITVTTTDGCGNATAVTYNTRIDNTPPAVTVGTIAGCYPTVAAAEAAALAATSATDNCPGALTEVASTVGTCSAVITVTTTDACGNASAVTYNTRIDNTAPVITCPAAITVCGAAGVSAANIATISATDNCPGTVTITFQGDVSTPSATAPYVITRTYRATDGCGNFAECTQLITVNPIATVNTVANQAVCNGASTTAVNFSSTATGGTIVYNWTNNTTSIGLAASGSGNIPSFNAINTGTAPVVATVTVTPSFTNAGVTCVGTPLSFTITVNPTATVNTVANQAVCNGASTTAVNFSSAATGGTIVYNWTNNTTSIGLAASGSG
ncbi:MAG: DUF2341 domain-containing protein, partial [Chitinophagaceae bacterium]|nr:DUF2341 domain-containing protein [Chitinophagaceae bacterium]